MFNVAVSRAVLALLIEVILRTSFSASLKRLERSNTSSGSSSIAVKSAIGLATSGQSLTGVILMVTVTVDPNKVPSDAL